jgi:hypothetical protein
MFELRTKLKSCVLMLCASMFRHRVIYAGLSGCHGAGCWITDKPELYGPIALLYAILALRG